MLVMKNRKKDRSPSTRLVTASPLVREALADDESPAGRGGEATIERLRG
jgi:hypothetical protein